MKKDFKSLIVILLFFSIWSLYVFLNHEDPYLRLIEPLFLIGITIYFILIQKVKNPLFFLFPSILITILSFFYKEMVYDIFPETVLLCSLSLLKNQLIKYKDVKSFKSSNIKNKCIKTFLLIVAFDSVSVIYYFLIILKNYVNTEIYVREYFDYYNSNILCLFIFVDIFLFIIGLKIKNISTPLKINPFYHYRSFSFLRAAEIVFLVLQNCFLSLFHNSSNALVTFWIWYYLFILFYDRFYIKYPIFIINSKMKSKKKTINVL